MSMRPRPRRPASASSSSSKTKVLGELNHARKRSLAAAKRTGKRGLPDAASSRAKENAGCGGSKTRLRSPSDVRLWYSGLNLRDFEWCLPTTSRTHDLAHRLVGCVSGSGGAVTLSAKAVAALATEELHRLGASKRRMAELLAITPERLSSLLHQTKPASTSPSRANEKVVYDLFKWLNLGLRDRMSVLYPLLDDEANEIALGAVPPIDKLVRAAKLELQASKLDAAALSGRVLSVTASTLEGLLSSPMAWGLAPMGVKAIYSRLWTWMKLSREERARAVECGNASLAARRHSLDPSPSAGPDVELLCRRIKPLVNEAGVTPLTFAGIILGDLAAVGLDLLSQPKAWHSASEVERKVYVSLLRWASLPRDQRMLPFDNFKRCSSSLLPSPIKSDQPHSPPINTGQVSRLLLDQVQGGSVTIKKLASAFGINRNFMSTVLHYPTDWSLCTPLQKRVYSAAGALLRADSGQEVSRNLVFEPKPLGGRRVRSKFTQDQLATLKEHFLRCPRPNSTEKKLLAQTLGLPLKTIKVYFCNQRKRVKDKEPSRSSIIDSSPPTLE